MKSEMLKRLGLALLMAMVAGGLVACGEDEGPAEEVGQNVDEAMEEAEASVDEAMEEAGESVEEMEQAIQEPSEENE